MAKAIDSGKAKGRSATAKSAGSKRGETRTSRGKVMAQTRARTAAAKSNAGEQNAILKFLHEVRVELRKVTWPTRKELVQSVLVVLVAVAIATVYVFVLDTAFSRGVDFVVNALTK